MGFDLTGRKPIKSTNGDYFRNNVWWWRPLWTFVGDVCNDILTEDEIGSGSYNDGQIIYKYKAIQIAKRLQKLLDNGSVKKFAEEYTNKLKALPLEECEHCNGDGMRTIEKDGKPTRIRCNSCNSEHKETDVPIGKVRGWSCHYPFDEDNVKLFTDFCRNSGGFEIW